jgi:hypothetical protein
MAVAQVMAEKKPAAPPPIIAMSIDRIIMFIFGAKVVV